MISDCREGTVINRQTNAGHDKSVFAAVTNFVLGAAAGVVLRAVASGSLVF
jgi:hypothetical protein